MAIKKSKFQFFSLTIIVLTFLIILNSSFITATNSCTSNKIAILGDSITNSYDKGGWGFEFKNKCNNLPINYGSSGKWTEWMLKTLKSDIVGKGHSHLIITGGTNDIWNQVNGKGYTPTETITSNLAEIYRLAKQDNIYVVAGTIPPFTNQGGSQKNNQVKEINQWIKSQLGTNVDQIVDFYGFLVGEEPCIKTEYARNCNDVHPNEIGYQAMADKVINEVFGGQAGNKLATQSAYATTSASLSELTTMMILGRHIRSEMENRVKGGLDLINKGGNFKRLILTGGCAKQKSDSKDLTCPYDCSSTCNEADQMEKYLLELDPNFNSRGITIIKEKKSGTTSSNLKNSDDYIQAGEKVLVVSDHKHVRPVAYCLRYSDPGANAYYYYIGKSSNPEVPSKNMVAEKQDYGNIANNCIVKFSGNGVQQPAQTTQPNYPGTYQQGSGVAVQYPQRQKEIDESWTKVSSFVGGMGVNQVWDTNSNSWKPFSVVYPVQTVSSSPATGITKGQTAFYLGSPLNQVSSGGMTTPLYDCSGVTNLPTQERQEGIASVGYNSNGKTREQIIIEQSNTHKIHPAVIAAHATLETNIGKAGSLAKNGFGGSAYCTDSNGNKKSKLTGCGWPDTCVGDCSCNVNSVNSDDGQLSCTAAKYDSFYDLKNVKYYNKCENQQGIKRWNCLQCVYQGDYDEIIPRSKSKTYFTRDGTCRYAENFKNIYCSWKNYFAQKGIPPPIATQTTSTAQTSSVGFPPAAGSFRFVVFSDFHNHFGKSAALVQQIKQLNPAFVIADGDSVNANSGAQKSWDKFFNQVVNPLVSAGIPVFHVTGNHDIEASGSEALLNSIWKNFYVQNPTIYNKVQNFNYQNFPRQSFDYAGKRFIIARIPGTSKANKELSYINGLVQPGSFIFGHANLVNGLPFNSPYHKRALDDNNRVEFLKMLTNTNSMYIHGHMHAFYPMLFTKNGLKAKNVFIGSLGERRSIVTSGKKQPNSFAVFDVGNSVNINAYLYENSGFRQFTSADASIYLPSTVELQSNNFQQLPVGAGIT